MTASECANKQKQENVRCLRNLASVVGRRRYHRKGGITGPLFGKYCLLLSVVCRSAGGNRKRTGVAHRVSDLVEREHRFPPMQRLFGAIVEVGLAADASPIVIFIDEIDMTLSLPFSAD